MNEAQKQGLHRVLEETSGLVTNRLINNAIMKNGVVTLEEATFFHNITQEIINEAAEDFIPSAMDTVGTDNNVQDDMILKDDEGNEYMFHPETGTLEALSVKPEEESNGAIGPDANVGEMPELDGLDSGIIGESTEPSQSVKEDEINDSIQGITQSEELTESEAIVQNLLRFK